jgi:hypothetical protein
VARGAKVFKGKRVQGALAACLITKTNRIHLVLCGMLNRTFGPYFAAIDRILILFMAGGRHGNCVRRQMCRLA